MSSSNRQGISVEMFVRGQSEMGVRDQQRRVIEGLSELEETGAIDEFDVHVWGKEVSPAAVREGTDCHRSTIGRVNEFAEWAEANGASLEPTFRRRRVTSSITDEDHTVISLPVMCLAVYEDEELDSVYPCHVDGTTCTVHESLERLGTDDPGVEMDELVAP